MGLKQFFFGDIIQQEVSKRTANLFNENVYQWLNKGQPVFMADSGENYVQKGYGAIPAVYEIVSLLSSKYAQCPVVQYEIKDQQKHKKYLNLLHSGSVEQKAQALYMKSQVFEEFSDERTQKLIDNPNELQTDSEFRELQAGYFLLMGNAYGYMNGPNVEKQQWSEMYLLPSQYMQIVSGGMFQPISGYRLETSRSEMMFPVEQVVHMKTMNPTWDPTGSQLYGVSPLKAMLGPLAILAAGDKETLKQLVNGGTFGMLSPKDKENIWTRDQADALKERLSDAKKSKDEVSRIFPSAVPLEWLQIGLPLGDMQMLDILKLKAEDVYRAYHVPLQLRSTDSSTFNNQSDADRKLVYNALAPLCLKGGEFYTKALYGKYNQTAKYKRIAKIDYTSLPELSKDMKEISDWLKDAHDLTQNEKREVRGWGKLDIENMDVPLMPSSYTRVDLIGLDSADPFKSTLDDDTKQ